MRSGDSLALADLGGVGLSQSPPTRPGDNRFVRQTRGGPAPVTTGETIVDIEHVSKVYVPSPLWLRFLLRSAITAPVQALTDVSLTLRAGTICAIVGPNGAGKSTLFRILTGLTTPSQGRVTVGGVDVMTDHLAVRQMIGFVPAGDNTLYLRLSCVENLLFHGRLQGLAGRHLHRRIGVVLDQVGLGGAGERVGFALSAGMRARLQLARALLHGPRLLVLDEPTAAVDPVGSHELLEIIQNVVRTDDVSVLLSSHRLEEIEALQDRVLILDRGRVLYDGDLGEFRRTYSRPVVELSFASPVAADRAHTLLAGLADVEAIRAVDGRSVTVSGPVTVGSMVSALGPVVDDLRTITEGHLPLRDLLRDIVADGRARRVGVGEEAP